MIADPQPSTPISPSPSKRQARSLRIIAAIVLVVGIFGADAVYWLRTPPANPSDDPSMLGNEKARSRQEQILYGNQAVLVDNLTNGLKQPGTEALLIVVTAVLVAGGCFYFARVLDAHAERSEGTDS